MTLNITVLCQNRIYQSSDFRLTEQPSGRVVTDASTKAVSIQNSEFMGLLTYTGIGRWAGKDTREWIIGWLESIGDRGVDDVCSGLASHATDWLKRISPRGSEPYLLTMVLGSFLADGSGAKVTVISNFEDAAGRNAPSDSLSVSAVQAGYRPMVLITGWKPAVTRDRRRWLESVARRHRDQPERIRKAMAECNEVAANSTFARGTISPACTVITMNQDGGGFQDVTPGSDVDIRTVSFGTAMPDLRARLQQHGFTVGEMRGATFARGNTQPTPPDPCPATTAGHSDQYELLEFSVRDARSARALAINGAGLIVGSFESSSQVGSRVWRSDVDSAPSAAHLADIAVQGQLGLDQVEAFVGGAQTEDGFVHAFVGDGSQIQALGDYPGRDNAAIALNSEGVAVGWASLSSTERGQAHQRPAIWKPDGGLMILTDIPADWGHAIAIAEDGTTLLWLHRGFHESWAALRSPEGEITLVGGEAGGRGVIPLGMNADKVLLGAIETAEGRVALLSEGAAGWRPLGTDPEWSPHAINDVGLVAGSVRVRGFERAWVTSGRLGERPTLLPYMAHHHCRPTSMNAHGDIVGTAATDHGAHAVLWRRRWRYGRRSPLPGVSSQGEI